MGTKQTPKQLREQAQKLLDQAAEEEARRENQIGKIVVEFIKSDFTNFDLDLFKAQTSEIWNTGKLSKKRASNRTAMPKVVAG